MELAVRRANASDLDAVWQLFEASCALQTPEDPGPDWHLGVYPTREGLAARAEAGELYVGEKNGLVRAALVLSAGEDEGYLQAPWTIPARPEDVWVLHLLVVDPATRGEGLGRQMVEAACRIARDGGGRVIHLDALEGNGAAARLYLACGFVRTCVMAVHYDDIGDARTTLFERDLTGDGGAAPAAKG